MITNNQTNEQHAGDRAELIRWHTAMADEPKRNQAKREKHRATAAMLEADAQRPAMKPLMDEQIAKAWAVAEGEHNASASVKRRITRSIEAAHSIKDQS